MTEIKITDRLPLLITNNICCAQAFTGRCVCLFDQSWTYGQVLVQARDHVHQGYHLLSHPQSGSVKPNQTPYKSLLLARYGPDIFAQFASLELIEQALAVYKKFQINHPTPVWPEQVLADFRTVDLSLMQSVFGRPQFAAIYN